MLMAVLEMVVLLEWKTQKNVLVETLRLFKLEIAILSLGGDWKEKLAKLTF